MIDGYYVEAWLDIGLPVHEHVTLKAERRETGIFYYNYWNEYFRDNCVTLVKRIFVNGKFYATELVRWNGIGASNPFEVIDFRYPGSTFAEDFEVVEHEDSSDSDASGLDGKEEI